MPKPVVRVGVACVKQNDKYLLGRRSAARGGFWEFPGGKIEPGESVEECVIRELREELRVQVKPKQNLLISSWEDETVIWELNFVMCELVYGNPIKVVHSEIAWFSVAEMKNIPFPAANHAVLGLL